MKTSQKWMYTLLLWIFGALVMSVAFGDGAGGTLIQAVIQIGLTIYIWTRPNVSDLNDENKDKEQRNSPKKIEKKHQKVSGYINGEKPAL